MKNSLQNLKGSQSHFLGLKLHSSTTPITSHGIILPTCNLPNHFSIQYHCKCRCQRYQNCHNKEHHKEPIQDTFNPHSHIDHIDQTLKKTFPPRKKLKKPLDSPNERYFNYQMPQSKKYIESGSIIGITESTMGPSDQYVRNIFQ